MGDLTDPTRATSNDFSRRAFTVLSGTATAFGATLAGALGQTNDFGRPHPPIVAEDDPAIVINRPTLQYGGRSLGAYYAAPLQQSGAPGIVVVQAIWGVDAQLRDTVRRLAKEGYATVAPDLYSGLGAPSGDGATDFAPYRDVAQKLVDATVDGDLAAAVSFLRAVEASGQKRRVGVVGFCMGGAIALRQTVDDAAFAAASVFYGKVRYGTSEGNAGPITPIALAYAGEMAVPLVGSWGGRDKSILPDDVRALEAKLTALRKPHDVKLYDEAGHAFFDDTRESYVASAAADAWNRTLVWFGRHLH